MTTEFKKKSIEDLKIKAETGDKEAQSALGLLFELGLEVKADPHEAAKYWGMAAKSGDAMAQYSLAQIITKNFPDTDENRLLSHSLFKKAEESGLIREDKVLRVLERDKGSAVKVMLVDDSATVRSPIKRYLEADGCEVIEAEDGQQALDLLRKHPNVKLVLSDLNMPVMDGFQLIKIMRSVDSFKEIPVVVITTENSKQMVERGKELGIQGWIVKPPKPHVLRKTLLKYT